MSNRLSNETSPYLLQHAGNPVDWQPWDEQALNLARETGKPILLSVGYSACHWCHVMAHESFEDTETAALMNRLFVNVKIDREERPDLDRIYQTAHQLLTGRAGGWPLTVFLTPKEHLPIFAGTYFPKERRYGMPAFKDVLVGIANYAKQEPSEILERGASLVKALDSLTLTDDDFGRTLDATPIDGGRARLKRAYDSEHGGFGGAPKFPQPAIIEFLLGEENGRRCAGHSESPGPSMAEATLTKMARSGLYDHLGGGFFRYCVDAAWTIPHFEKMLYDNAALLGLYADAYAATRKPEHRHVVVETADWVMRDMQAPDGGYYSSLDADADGEEGKFYVWTPTEVGALLDADEASVLSSFFGLDSPPNFEGKHWHLQQKNSIEDAAAAAGVTADAAERLLTSGRRKLLEARAVRTWPGRDTKRIASWNGLMIAGLARAARRLEEPRFAESATRAADFIIANMLADGRLKSTYKDGRARHSGYLDDYAFLSMGLLELLQTRWRTTDLETVVDLVEVMLRRFADPAGGFFFTADDHETLIHRPKPLADEALPAGNGIAALVLQALGHLLGEGRYLDAASKTVKAALPKLETYPEAHTSLLRALAAELEPPEILVVRGERDELSRWCAEMDREFRAAYSFFIPAEEKNLPGVLEARKPRRRTTAYYCVGSVCREPVTSLAELRSLIEARAGS